MLGLAHTQHLVLGSIPARHLHTKYRTGLHAALAQDLAWLISPYNSEIGSNITLSEVPLISPYLSLHLF